MTSAFSSSDDVMERTCVDYTVEHTDAAELVAKYELHRSVNWVRENCYKKVALQFPDTLLVDAPAVSAHIRSEICDDATVFILGDTSYGSCCVDEVGAQHYQADSIIHFGPSCLSPTSRLPVLYVFGRRRVDVDDCVRHLSQLCADFSKTLLLYSTDYLHAIDNIYEKLCSVTSPPLLTMLIVPQLQFTENLTQKDETLHGGELHVCGRRINIPSGDNIEDYTAVFIGESNCATLISMMMTLNKCPFYTYDPSTSQCQLETLKVNKALMKRYFFIEKLKDAGIVGIVAGTLGVSKYRDIMEHVKALVKKSGKKSYTFVVGKLNPAKLANFAEIDVYVLVACQESSLIDTSDFYRPVVTPLEVEFALNKGREWTGVYNTDFTNILPGGPMYVAQPESSDQDDDLADVSLISNKVRQLGVRNSPDVPEISSQQMMLRSEALAVTHVAHNAGDFLSGRQFQGLEQRIGETPVTKALDGQTGIAAGYQHEPAD